MYGVQTHKKTFRKLLSKPPIAFTCHLIDKQGQPVCNLYSARILLFCETQRVRKNFRKLPHKDQGILLGKRKILIIQRYLFQHYCWKTNSIKLTEIFLVNHRGIKPYPVMSIKSICSLHSLFCLSFLATFGCFRSSNPFQYHTKISQ